MTTSLLAILGLGTQEILILLLLGALLFGARKLPDLGRSLGRTILAFRRSVNGEEEPADVLPPVQR